MNVLRAKIMNTLRRIGAHPRLLPYYALFLATPTVRPSLLFAYRELKGARGIALYHLRENGRNVALRHVSGDLVILGEVFNKHYYRPSGEIAQVLTEPNTIVDLGGNIGLFSLFAAVRWPLAQIVAYEPDADNAAVLEINILANGLGDRWKLIEAAASNRDGSVSFVSGLAAISHMADNTESEGTIEVTMLDVLPQISQADLLKMDIEGGEWAILGDPRFREAPPRVAVLEYHSHLCPGPNPRAEAETALRAAGMHIKSTADHGDAQGVLWAWRA
jgi:FkbM family methyltransferase